MENSKRIDGLDLMKAFAILVVITLHTGLYVYDFMGFYSIKQMGQYALRIISEGVPFFVTINGFLLLRKKSLDLTQHLKKMGKIFALFMIWAVILAFAGLALARGFGNFTFGDFVDTILNTQVGAPYTGVLWFLQNLLGVYFVYPILRLVYEKDFKLFQYLFWVVFAFVVGLNCVVLVRDLLEAHHNMVRLSAFIDFCNRFKPIGNDWYLFYFMFGGMIWHYYDRVKEKKVLLSVVGVLSWPAAFGVGFALSKLWGYTYNAAFNYGSIFMVLFILGFFALTADYQCNNPVKRFVSSVGTNTFGMYFSHWLFIFLIDRYFVSLRDHRLLMYLCVVAASYLFSVIVGKIPYVKKLISI